MTSNETTNAAPRNHSPRRRLLWFLVAIPVAVVAGAGVLKAQAMGAGFGFGHGGSPEQHKAFMERRLDRALGLVKADDTQRAAIKAIFERAFTELHPIHQEHQRLRRDLVAAFAANPVDRATVEQLRLQTTQLVDRGSQVLSRALLDAAQVLRPEQRQQLVSRLADLHARGHHRNGDL